MKNPFWKLLCSRGSVLTMKSLNGTICDGLFVMKSLDGWTVCSWRYEIQAIEMILHQILRQRIMRKQKVEYNSNTTPVSQRLVTFRLVWSEPLSRRFTPAGGPNNGAWKEAILYVRNFLTWARPFCALIVLYGFQTASNGRKVKRKTKTRCERIVAKSAEQVGVFSSVEP